MEKMVKLHIMKCGPEKKLEADKSIDLDEKIRRIREQNKAREKRFKEIENDKLQASNDGSENSDTRCTENSKPVDGLSGTAMKGVMPVSGKKITKGRGQRLLEMSKAPLKAMEFESRARKKLKELEENGQLHKESKCLSQISMENKSLPNKDEWGKNETDLKETQEVLSNTDKKDENHGQNQYDRPELRNAQGSSWTSMKPNDSQGNTLEEKELCCEDWDAEVMAIDELTMKPDIDMEPEVSEQSKEQVPTGSDFYEVNVKKNENSDVKERNSAGQEHSAATTLGQICEICHDQAVLENGKNIENENASTNEGNEFRGIHTEQTITVLPNKQEKSFREQVKEESSFPEETKIKTKSTKQDMRPKITVNTKMIKTLSSSSFDESMAMFSPLDIPNNWGDCDFDESSNESTFYQDTLSFN